MRRNTRDSQDIIKAKLRAKFHAVPSYCMYLFVRFHAIEEFHELPPLVLLVLDVVNLLADGVHGGEVQGADEHCDGILRGGEKS